MTGALPEGVKIDESDSDCSVTSSDYQNSMRSNSRGHSDGSRRGSKSRSLSARFGADEFELYIGQKVEVNDVFRTQKVGARSKWRVAEIMSNIDNIVRIHFIGFDPKWDENIDLLRESDRIREFTGHSEKKKQKDRPHKSFSNFDRPHNSSLSPVQESPIENSPKHRALSWFGPDGRGEERKFGDTSHYLDAVSEGNSENTSEKVNSLKRINRKDSVNALAIIESMEKSDTEETELSLDEKIRIALEMADRNYVSESKKGTSFSAPTSAPSPSIRQSFKMNSAKNASTRQSFNLKSVRSASIRQSFNMNSARADDVDEVADEEFKKRLEDVGLFIKKVRDDGNSLFRAVSHQMYLSESKHAELRTRCMEHMRKHTERFDLYCTDNIEQHIRDIGRDGCPGDELEIRVLEEVLDRILHVYNIDTVGLDMKPIPMNLNEDEVALTVNVKPIKIINIGNSVYSSVVDELEPFPLSEKVTNKLSDFRSKSFALTQLNNDD
jgi:hypothetical protein